MTIFDLCLHVLISFVLLLLFCMFVLRSNLLLTNQHDSIALATMFAKRPLECLLENSTYSFDTFGMLVASIRACNLFSHF